MLLLPSSSRRVCAIAWLRGRGGGGGTGLEEYLYAEVDTWQTICSDGTQVFHFASGQAEAHRPDGSKEARCPPTCPIPTALLAHVPHPKRRDSPTWAAACMRRQVSRQYCN